MGEDDLREVVPYSLWEWTQVPRPLLELDVEVTDRATQVFKGLGLGFAIAKDLEVGRGGNDLMSVVLNEYCKGPGKPQTVIVETLEKDRSFPAKPLNTWD